jgi:hypothetical protein
LYKKQKLDVILMDIKCLRKMLWNYYCN